MPLATGEGRNCRHDRRCRRRLSVVERWVVSGRRWVIGGQGSLTTDRTMGNQGSGELDLPIGDGAWAALDRGGRIARWVIGGQGSLTTDRTMGNQGLGQPDLPVERWVRGGARSRRTDRALGNQRRTIAE